MTWAEGPDVMLCESISLTIICEELSLLRPIDTVQEVPADITSKTGFVCPQPAFSYLSEIIAFLTISISCLLANCNYSEHIISNWGRGTPHLSSSNLHACSFSREWGHVHSKGRSGDIMCEGKFLNYTHT